MTRPALELANPKFIDFMVGRRSDGGIDGYLGIQVVEFEAGRLVGPGPPVGARKITKKPLISLCS